MLTCASRSTDFPLESSLAPLFDKADLVDAFAVTLPVNFHPDIDTAAQAVFGHPALWFRFLLACRDAIVTPFGLKTSADLRNELQAKAIPHVDFFPILSRTNDEMVIGADDHHLNFRGSLLLRKGNASGCDELVLTTVVDCNNLLGHAYIAAITPFHKLVVRSSLSRALNQWKTMSSN